MAGYHHRNKTQSLFGEVLSTSTVLNGEKFNCYKSLRDGTTKVEPAIRDLKIFKKYTVPATPCFISIDSSNFLATYKPLY